MEQEYEGWILQNSGVIVGAAKVNNTGLFSAYEYVGGFVCACEVT